MSDRLARIRHQEGASLRAFVRTLETRTGLSVAHDSTRRYESGQTRVPAEYVAAVCHAFGVSAEWLLLGEGSPSRRASSLVEQAFHQVSEIVRDVEGLGARAPSVGPMGLVKGEWERFTSGLPHRHRLREAIVRSWTRSRAAGVAHDPETLPLSRVPDRELERRRERARTLIDVAGPHLDWLSAAIHDLPTVAYLVCADGVVLHSVATDPELLDAWHLHPGVDWSEEAMGTNGAGTALASGSVVAVLGPEHYMQSSHGCTSLAAPIRDGSGTVVGAIDLSTSFAGWRPERLLFVAYAADMIERALPGTGGGE